MGCSSQRVRDRYQEKQRENNRLYKVSLLKSVYTCVKCCVY